MTNLNFFHAGVHVDKGTAKIPRAALNFEASVSVGEASTATADKPSTVPVSMRARSADVVNHLFWGRCVHDFAGLQQASAKLPFDYCHDAKEVLGYSDRQEIANNELVMHGVLIPHKPLDRVDEIITKQKAGFEWQGSVTFDPAAIVIEIVPEGVDAEVNGGIFSGPGVIFREWMLRGAAFCPYGQDPNTSVQFSNSGDEVAIRCKERSSMSKIPTPVKPNRQARRAAASMSAKTGKQAKRAAKTKAGKFAAPEDETQLDAENEELDAESEDTGDPEADTETEGECDCPEGEECDCDQDDEADPDAEDPVEMEVETDEEKAQANAKLSVKKQLNRFVAAFGAARGAKWFAAGMTFAQAQSKFTAVLTKQNNDLRKKVGELTAQVTALGGEEEPVTFTAADERPNEKTKGKAGKFTGHLPTGAAKFAASLKLPK